MIPKLTVGPTRQCQRGHAATSLDIGLSLTPRKERATIHVAVVVSNYVKPSQFMPTEDLTTDHASDIRELASTCVVDARELSGIMYTHAQHEQSEQLAAMFILCYASRLLASSNSASPTAAAATSFSHHVPLSLPACRRSLLPPAILPASISTADAVLVVSSKRDEAQL